jgi:lipoate-protein ligase A
VVRRRSGGGAVLLRPGHDLWIDVTIPRRDPLWEEDVAVSFHWLGRVWVEALATLGVVADVHLGPATKSSWSRSVCFAALGAGEVTLADVHGKPRKVIGLSQRRSRDAARFQCLALGSWDAAELLALLSLDDDERAAGEVELAEVATGAGRTPAEMTAAFTASLPT